MTCAEYDVVVVTFKAAVWTKRLISVVTVVLRIHCFQFLLFAFSFHCLLCVFYFCTRATERVGCVRSSHHV